MDLSNGFRLDWHKCGHSVAAASVQHHTTVINQTVVRKNVTITRPRPVVRPSYRSSSSFSSRRR